MAQARIELANIQGRASLLVPDRPASSPPGAAGNGTRSWAPPAPRAEVGGDTQADPLQRGRVRVIDVERRSHGQFSADPMDALQRWTAFRAFADHQEADPSDAWLDPKTLGPCVPRPRQVFAIGLNYRSHAQEARMELPAQPLVFTKFPSCLAGGYANIPLTSDKVDWEVELVAVIGALAERVSEADALHYVAGYCVGQDISDRQLQFLGPAAQFSLGKSATNFGPIGPALVWDPSLDPNQLELTCAINGERMQHGNTSDMVFTVASIIAYLTQFCSLYPGDLIFTGTPNGVGSGRKPPLFLKAGDVIRSEITGLGTIEQVCTAGPTQAS